MRKIAAVFSCLLLAGCWESDGSVTFIREAELVGPFSPGKVISFNPDKPQEVSHAVLIKEGREPNYRLVARGKKDRGDSVVVFLFALPSLPRDVFVFQAMSDDKCRPSQTCRSVTATSARDFGLVRRTKSGAEVISPDCDKASAVAKLPGVKASDYGICTFTSRASLETALLGLAKQSWKPNVVYKYE